MACYYLFKQSCSWMKLGRHHGMFRNESPEAEPVAEFLGDDFCQEITKNTRRSWVSYLKMTSCTRRVYHWPNGMVEWAFLNCGTFFWMFWLTCRSSLKAGLLSLFFQHPKKNNSQTIRIPLGMLRSMCFLLDVPELTIVPPSGEASERQVRCFFWSCYIDLPPGIRM